ncbi:hypothetical protein ACETU7_21260 [Rhodococcus sp. 3Y1]
MAVDGTDHDSPTLDQARRQLEHYGLGSDPQAVLVAVRLISAGARLGRATEVHFARYGLSTGRYRLLADLEDHDGEKSPHVWRLISASRGPRSPAWSMGSSRRVWSLDVRPRRTGVVRWSS